MDRWLIPLLIVAGLVIFYVVQSRIDKGEAAPWVQSWHKWVLYAASLLVLGIMVYQAVTSEPSGEPDYDLLDPRR